MAVYRIDTKLNKLQCEKIAQSLSPIEVERLERYDLKAYDIEIDGKVSSFIITDRYVITRIILFLRQKNIEFEYDNVSDDVLIGNISFEGTPFENDVNEFIQNNITVDHILDKINKFGIESLNQYDKLILENN